jgi:hypothetical protein
MKANTVNPEHSQFTHRLFVHQVRAKHLHFVGKNL